MQLDHILQAMLMYFILPFWLVAGFADYWCHRIAHIERTSGWKESALHLLQLFEMAVPVVAALFLEITAGVILLMIVFFILHQATALWDVHYASSTREVSPLEQHVHSFLEMLPLMGLLLVVALKWEQFIALFGFAPARFDLVLKDAPLPWAYVGSVLAIAALFEFLPYIEEFWRGWRIQRENARSPSGLTLRLPTERM
jgi:hypothetical protein